MRMYTRPFVVIITLLMSFQASSQEHPFIAHYELTELEGSIRIDWTIQGGSTCNGQDVERSTDGVTFSNVHRIEGVCGDPGSAVPYGWLDQAPPEFSTVYYRIKLGVDGYTSVKAVVFDQLTTSSQRFFPSPVSGTATLAFNIGQGDAVDIVVVDAGGRVVWERLGLAGSVHVLELAGLPQGNYTYLATSKGRRFAGRFVKV